MRAGFDKAKSVWNEKVDRLKTFISGSSAIDDYQTVFDGVLMLFSGHGGEAVRKLETLYSDFPDEVEFYIPQLVVFLIYGSFEASGALQTAILNMCRSSAIFAHRVYWFIVAFCLSGAGVTSEGVIALKQLLAEIEAIGEQPAMKLALGQAYQEDSSSDAVDASAHSEDALDIKNTANFTTLDIKGAKYPISLARLPQGCKSQFAPALLFWDRMTDVSRTLTTVPRNNRTEELRTRLCFVDDFLPSATIYAPFGNEYHRIWAVHIEESFAFSTKDRVPFLVCLEVVDYELPKRKLHRRQWWSSEKISFQKTFKIGQRAFTLKLGGSNPESMHGGGGPEDLRSWKTDTQFSYAEGGRRDPTNTPENIRSFPSACFSSEAAFDDTKEKNSANIVRSAYCARITGTPPPPNTPSCIIDGEIGQWDAKGMAKISSSADANDLSHRSPLTTFPFASISNPLLSTTKKKITKIDDQEQIRLFRKGDSTGLSTPKSEDTEDETHSHDGFTGYSPAASCTPVERGDTSLSAWKGVIAGKTSLAESGDGSHQTGEPSSPKSGSHDSPEKEKEWYGSTDLAPGKDRKDSDAQEAPPTVVFKESWQQKEARIRRLSSVGHLSGWRLLPVIVKSGDDLRQEQCAAQVIAQIHHLLQKGRVGCWLRPYGIVAISPDSGIIEAIPDTVSLDVLRRRDVRYVSLMNFFERFFGPEGSIAYTRARNNFMRSLAGYCIVCYILQLKDRHNGNILLDTSGHIIHIDFGFMLASSPGGNMGFEKAPFKLTAEFVELLEGAHSPLFHRFRELCVKTFMELRKNNHRIVLLLEMLSKGNEHLPCFGGNPQRVMDELKSRFRSELHDRAAMEHVHGLVDLALDNWTTTCYDSYQRCCVGIF
eukprot:CAMPEP_0182426888 /NCGR_PEP_ID=MMETSP1167-20130531/13404_1 /TAXON_ID=2988 /ORGANISM="Mallomonas Sp, Strain CCMP3275" /LENGTH=878 /DNA_ID=CAMNT_0024608629 /DNA_START=749 /DNA_END=3385 /DNA_ORIENTATION=+